MEELTWRFLSLPPLAQMGLYYGLVCIGVAIGIVISKTEVLLSRSPYFGLIWLMALLNGATGFVTNPFLVDAMMTQRVWMLQGADFLVTIATGIVVGGIAVQRALDAWGGRSGAWLAIIPFANLWLLFTPSRASTGPQERSVFDRVSGWFGVVLAAVCMVLSRVVGRFLENDAVQRVEDAFASGALNGFVLP